MRRATVAAVVVGLVFAPATAVGAEHAAPPVRSAPERCATEEPLWSDDVSGELDAALRCVAHLGLMDGYRDGRFHPEFLATRADAVWAIANVLRVGGVAMPEDPPDAFDDDTDSGVELFADQLAALGVLKGTSARTLDADAILTRGQLASLAARSAAVGDRALDDSVDHFVDDEGSVHETAIDQGAAGGIWAGTGDHRFEPNRRLIRGQLAIMSARLVSWLEDASAEA